MNEPELNGDRSSWLRCYRCWARDLEVQLHYDAILRVDPETGEPSDRLDEVQEAVHPQRLRPACTTSPT